MREDVDKVASGSFVSPLLLYAAKNSVRGSLCIQPIFWLMFWVFMLGAVCVRFFPRLILDWFPEHDGRCGVTLSLSCLAIAVPAGLNITTQAVDTLSDRSSQPLVVHLMCLRRGGSALCLIVFYVSRLLNDRRLKDIYST
jgi:hypothetical protein